MKLFILISLAALVASKPALEKPFHPLFAPITPGSLTRIINGQEANLGDWPWQASMQRFGSHFCGGSLIATGYVMSAAHCTVYQTGVTANLGAKNYHTPEQSISVSQFLAHPQYDENTIDYDYGIAVLATPATFSANVQPIELAEAGVEYPGGTQAITTGWGYIVRFPATIPDNLQVAYIPLQASSVCADFWSGSIVFSDRMQCAAGNGGSTSCMGDSGGPLVVPDSSTNSGYRLVGAVSWGSSLCSTDAPSAYAKISAGRSWIDSIAFAQD